MESALLLFRLLQYPRKKLLPRFLPAAVLMHIQGDFRSPMNDSMRQLYTHSSCWLLPVVRLAGIVVPQAAEPDNALLAGRLVCCLGYDTRVLFGLGVGEPFGAVSHRLGLGVERRAGVSNLVIVDVDDRLEVALGSVSDSEVHGGREVMIVNATLNRYHLYMHSLSLSSDRVILRTFSR